MQISIFRTRVHIFEQTMSSLAGEKLIVEHIIAVRKRECVLELAMPLLELPVPFYVPM